MVIADFRVTNSKKHISNLTLVSGTLDINYHLKCFHIVPLYPTTPGALHVPPIPLFAPFPPLEAHTSQSSFLNIGIT